MKFFAVVVLMAVVATALAAKLPAEENLNIKPEAEAEVKAADPRDKRGILYASPYAAAYSYPYAAAYSYPSAYAYTAPVAYSAYRAAYYPSYVSSYIVG